MKSFTLQFLVGLAVKMVSLMEKRPKILNLDFWASSVKFQRLTTILIFECFIEQIRANFTISNLTRFCSPEITQNVQETLFCKMIGYLRPLETFPVTTNRWVMRLTKNFSTFFILFEKKGNWKSTYGIFQLLFTCQWMTYYDILVVVQIIACLLAGQFSSTKHSHSCIEDLALYQERAKGQQSKSLLQMSQSPHENYLKKLSEGHLNMYKFPLQQ